MNAYDKDKEKILRDYLALDRTRLANERTFLAYVRTFIGFAASGAGIIKLLDGSWVPAGYALLAMSPLFLVVGIIRFAIMNKKLNSLGE